MLGFKVSHESGKIQPGASLSFELSRDGNTADVPQNAVSWEVYHNGKELNYFELSQLCVAQVLHTFNRPQFGFRLRPEVRGVFAVVAAGQPRTELAGRKERWRYEIEATKSESFEEEMRRRFSEIEAKLDSIESQLSGLVK